MFQTNQMIILGLLGQTGVGKSHLINRYLKNSFPDKIASTIAIQFATGFYKMQDSTKLKLKIWDTSGQQKYKQIVCYHLKQAQCVMIVYDITDQKSFDKIDQWLVKLEKQSIEPDLLILIGNKNDLNQNRKIKYDEGQQKAGQIGALFYEINSFNYEQVTETFNQIIQSLIQKKAQKQIKQKQKELVAFKKQKWPLMPEGIQGSNHSDAVCSNCQIF